MRSFILVTFITVAISCFSSCRRGEETHRYELSPVEESFIPYTENTTVPFQHSQGLEFSFIVQQRVKHWEQSEIEHSGDNYVSYQVDRTTLVSNEPELEITIAVFPQKYQPLLSINLNRFDFYLYTEDDPALDSLLVEDKVYREVYILTNQATDLTKIVPDSIFYSRQEGIIKIIMTNNEEYTLNR